MATESDQRSERTKLHDALRDDLFKRQISNAENLDKAILTYSTAGLGLSLTFLKDFVPWTAATAGYFLVLSWVLFLIAVILTITSYAVGQRAIARQLELNKRYYIDCDDTALLERNRYSSALERLNESASASFVSALLATALFVGLNLGSASTMTSKGNSYQKIVMPDHTRGAPVPGIQSIPAPRPSSPPGQSPDVSVPVPGIQPAPSPPAPVPAPAPAQK